MSGLFYFCKMPKQFTLGKNERLKSRKQIGKLFAEGKRFVVSPFRIYFLFNEMFPQHPIVNVQFGTGVSSKSFKRAVDRNRIKRLTREAWRLQKTELNELLKAQKKQLNVFFIYTGREVPDFTTVKDKVAVVLKNLLDKVNENNPSNP